MFQVSLESSPSSSPEHEGSPKPKAKPQETHRQRRGVLIGLVCANPESLELYAEEINNGPDDLAFAVEDPADLPETLEKAKVPADVVLAIATPNENMGSVPEAVREIAGEDVATVLGDIPPTIGGIAAQVVFSSPRVASSYDEVIPAFGVDPVRDAQAVLTRTHSIGLAINYDSLLGAGASLL